MEFMSEPEAVDRLIAVSKSTAKPSHTPGPWTVEPSDIGDPSVGQAPTPPVVFVSVPNDDRFRRIDIAVVGSTIYDNSEDGYSKSWGDPDANACLIAAAPELLAGLKAFVSFGDYAHNHIEDDEARAVLVEALADAKALIAKAEGR